MTYRWLFLLLLLIVPSVSATLNCTISDSACYNTDVFHISSMSNAHAEQNNESDYDFIVCCSETTGITLSTTCGTTVLKLSTSTDAHVEKSTESDYPFSVCLNSTSGSISCSYQSTSCSEACLGTISTTITGGNTNLHIANCSAGQYATYICCSYDTPAGTGGGGGGGGTDIDNASVIINTTKLWLPETKYPILITLVNNKGQFFDTDLITVVLNNMDKDTVVVSGNVTKTSTGHYLALISIPNTVPLGLYIVSTTITYKGKFYSSDFKIILDEEEEDMGFLEIYKQFIIDLLKLLFEGDKQDNLVLETKDDIVLAWNELVEMLFKKQYK